MSGQTFHVAESLGIVKYIVQIHEHINEFYSPSLNLMKQKVFFGNPTEFHDLIVVVTLIFLRCRDFKQNITNC